MTDARIITREVLLELANNIYRTAFEAGYEAGSLVACLETPEPGSNAVPLKGLKLTPNPAPNLQKPEPSTGHEGDDGLTDSERESLIKEIRGKHEFWKNMRRERSENVGGI